MTDGAALSPTPPPYLSVVLPVRNGEPFLRYQLEALAAQRCSFPWEMIVVDNGSSDGSARTASAVAEHFSSFRLLSEPRRGKSYALNTGIAAARGDLLVFVDADDEVDQGYLEAMAGALDEHELVQARCDTVLLNPPWAREEITPPDRLVDILGFRTYIPGGLIGIRAATCRRVGEFATELAIGEDIDFTWRAQLLGVSTGVAPDAVLHLRRVPDAWGNFWKARSYARAFVWLYQRYRDLGQPRRSLGEVAGHVQWMLTEALHGDDHWQWHLAWWAGQLEGRLEESLRQRVWYP